MLKSDLKHEEPMDTGEILYEDYEEEGEIHSSDEEGYRTGRKNDGHRENSELLSDGFPLAKAQEQKRLQLAKRFSVPSEQSEMVFADSDNISRLYKSLGIKKETEKHYRFNVIHMRGTQHMSTEDVFEYFRLFDPSDVEWINDVSCNVVCIDHISAAKVLLNLSKEIKNLDKIRFNANPFSKELKDNSEEMEFDFDEDAVDAREIQGAIPPGFWRIGVPFKETETILLRLATRSDKKQKYAEKNSEYYKKFGNPHFGNMRGLVSGSLRSKFYNKYKKSPNNNEMGNVDIKKNPWGHLAEEWSKLDEVKDVRSRISLKRGNPSVRNDLRLSIHSKYEKRQKMEEQSDCEDSIFKNEYYDKGKFPKMTMYADEEEKIETNSRRKRLASQTELPFVEDLRLKIDRSREKKKMLDQSYKRKRYSNRYTYVKQDILNKTIRNEYYTAVDDNDNDVYEGDEDDDDDEDEDEDEDEEKGSAWALEQYSDLRESLKQSKKCRLSNNNKTVEKSDSENNDDSDDIYSGDLSCRSPLQIEFENDEYFENDSV